ALVHLRPAGGLVPVVDPQAPREVGRLAVQLVVEPVAEAPDRLRDGDPRCDRVAERRQLDADPPAADPGAEAAERDGPPDPEAALPDVERLDRVAALAEVGLRRGDHVVEAAADDAGRDRVR